MPSSYSRGMIPGIELHGVHRYGSYPSEAPAPKYHHSGTVQRSRTDASSLCSPQGRAHPAANDRMTGGRAAKSEEGTFGMASAVDVYRITPTPYLIKVECQPLPWIVIHLTPPLSSSPVIRKASTRLHETVKYLSHHNFADSAEIAILCDVGTEGDGGGKGVVQRRRKVRSRPPEGTRRTTMIN